MTLALLAVVSGLISDREFRFEAPDAKSVRLVLDGKGTLPMQNREGTWTASVKDLAPGVYGYHFIVDGRLASDPKAKTQKEIHGGGSESFLVIDGGPNDLWAGADRLPGRLEKLQFSSAMFEETRRAMVYVPGGTRPDERLPVTYLLHGVMDTDLAWTQVGFAEAVLENLIRQGKAQRQILVMPLGYATKDSGRDVQKLLATPTQRWKELFADWDRHVTEELMPAVESKYPVAKGRAFRSIAGVSMGGAQALYVGLNHPERFSRIGSFGGAMMIFGGSPASWIKPRSIGSGQNIQLYCGTTDFVKPYQPLMEKWLLSRSAKFSKASHEGGHEWRVWIQDLASFLSTKS